MKFIGVRQSLEEENGFWNVHWDIRPHIGTTNSNIQAVDKHFNTMGLLICAAVKEVNNRYLSYITFYESESRPSKCRQHHQQRWCKILWTGVNLLL